MTTDPTREPCIDAETLAAWADGGLPATKAARVELHLSNCDRCQEVLAAFVRSQPVVAVVIPFWSRRSVRLGAAGLAVAASLVLIVWTVRPPVRGVAEVPGVDSRVASNEAAPTAPPVAPVQPSPDLQQPRFTPAPPAANQSAKTRSLDAAKPAPAAPPPLPTSAFPSPPPPVAQPVVVAAAPPPPPEPRTLGGNARMASSPAIPAMAELVLDPSATIIEFVAPDPIASEARTAARAGAARAGSGGRGGEVLTPTRWRIVGGTRVDRSSDGGVTWTTLLVEPPVTTVLTAGVGTSQTVCWIVGRQGAVLVAADGRTLRRVSPPTTDNLIGVIAIDGLRATVTVAGGRTFSTVDGGLTWTPGRMLQGF